jgi:hypothetical protein
VPDRQDNRADAEMHTTDTSSSHIEKPEQTEPPFDMIAGSDHEGPPRRRKLGWSRQRVHGLAACHRFYPHGCSPKHDKHFRSEKLHRC